VLAEVVGAKAVPRTEITKKLWAYIKKNSLQDKKNRPDQRGREPEGSLRRKSSVNMFAMTKLVSKHLERWRHRVGRFLALRASEGRRSTTVAFLLTGRLPDRAEARFLNGRPVT
jgi:hypothetical protein